jgi:uncharacterized phiE125 gp8 family phage protein
MTFEPTYTLITAPNEEPTTIATLRDHGTLDSAVPDALLTLYLKAARRTAEYLTGRALVTQTWRATLPAFAEQMVLARPPVQSVSWVKYFDTTGTEQTLSNTYYRFHAKPIPGYVTRIDGMDWPDVAVRPDPVTIQFVCGYGAAAAVPEDIVNWILVRAATAVDNREEVDRTGRLGKLEFVDSLLQPYETYWGI